MIRKLLLAVFLVGAAYLLFWPVPVNPVAWQSPPNSGYTGPFTANDRLKGMELLPIAPHHGPEDIALDAQGRLYAATGEGDILRLDSDGTNPTIWAHTGGRPLGIDFDAAGNLIVADAYLGLLSIAPDASVTVLTTEADGIPILYADDVDVAPDGIIYFSDASVRFPAQTNGGTLAASLLDLTEHSGTGRLLAYDPTTGETSLVLGGLQFANGVAVDPGGQYVLVNETGAYRVTRYWLRGDDAGTHDVLIDNLPAFPDNISMGLNGRIWVALVSPRSKALDDYAGQPFLRKIIQRLPEQYRPAATIYGHIIAIDADGNVLEDLQDPTPALPVNTAITETEDYLYIASLLAPNIGRISKKSVGID